MKHRIRSFDMEMSYCSRREFVGKPIIVRAYRWVVWLTTKVTKCSPGGPQNRPQESFAGLFPPLVFHEDTKAFMKRTNKEKDEESKLSGARNNCSR